MTEMEIGVFETVRFYETKLPSQVLKTKDRNKASVPQWGKVITRCLPGDHIHAPSVDERSSSTPFAALSAAEEKRQRKLERNKQLLERNKHGL